MKKLATIIFSFLALSSFAQKVSNQLSFQKGQKLEMNIQIKSTVSSAMGESDINANLTRVFDVEDVTNGTTTIEHKIKHIQGGFESAMGSQSFDSDKDKDMKSETGKSLDKTLKSKYTMTIDATGKVLSANTGKDSAQKKEQNPGSADMVANLLSQIIGGIKTPEAGSSSDFRILPDHEVGKGDTWIDTTGGKTVGYTIIDINDSDIIVSFVENTTTERKQEVMGMSINISSKDKTTGRITIDRKTGLLKLKTSTTDSEGTMEAMGQSAPMTTKTTRTITVTTN